MPPVNNVIQFGILKPLVEKIIKVKNQIPILQETFNEIERKKLEFMSDINKEHIYFAFLCILALIFDFILSRITMKPLVKSTNMEPEVFALIFNLMDAFIAILASGILANDLLGKFKHKKIWIPVLWVLCLIKITLFVGFAFSSMKLIGILFIVLLVLLVYAILHFAGGGLYFLFGKIKFAFLEIWHDSPIQKKQELQKLERQLSMTCQSNNFDIIDVKTYFGI